MEDEMLAILTSCFGETRHAGLRRHLQQLDGQGQQTNGFECQAFGKTKIECEHSILQKGRLSIVSNS